MKLVDIIYQLNPDEFRQLLRQVQYPGPDGIGRRFTDRQIQALTELLYPLPIRRIAPPVLGREVQCGELRALPGSVPI